MTITNHINTIDDYAYSSHEYLSIIRDHRDYIIKTLPVTIIDPTKELNLYRSRIHAYLQYKGYLMRYHLPILVLNDMDTQFDFGGRLIHSKLDEKNNLNMSIKGVDTNNRLTIYLPPASLFDEYLIKVKRNGG